MRRGFLVTVLLAFSAASASAQIMNGGFEAGGTGWIPNAPATWTVEFLAAGGNPNGYARIQSPFGNSGGEGCVEQAFVCGVDPQGVCVITVDFRHRSIDAGQLTGRVKIYIDGQLMHTSAPADEQDWTSVTFTVPCGTHTIRLCLEVDPGNNGWEAGFDNAVAFCDIPVGSESETWGRVKQLYE